MDPLTSLLACPNCRARLEIKDAVNGVAGIEDGRLVCAGCLTEFYIKAGVCYFDFTDEEKVPSGEDGWKLEEFGNMYLTEEYHTGHIDYLEKFEGMTKEMAQLIGGYENSRVKGRLLEWLTPADGDVILDLGCGVGYFLFDIMKRYPGIDLQLLGIDAFSRCVNLYRKRQCDERKKNMLPIVGNAESLPFEDGSIDKIVSSELLEHVKDPGKVLSEMNRVLRADGKLFLSTPSRKALEFWDSVSGKLGLVGLAEKKSAPDEDFYDEPLFFSEIKDFAESAGLVVKRHEFNVNPLMRKIIKVFPQKVGSGLVTLLEPMFKGERSGAFTLVELVKPSG